MVGIQEAWGKHRAAREGGGLEILRPRQHIISRFPLLEAPDSKGLYTFIEVLPGTMVAMANMHLPDDPMGRTWSDRVPRRRRWKKINGRFACQRPCLRRKTVRSAKEGVPVFLTGDFNSPSHLDWTKPTVGVLQNHRYVVEWPVTKFIQEKGLKSHLRGLRLHRGQIQDSRKPYRRRA